MEQEIVNQGKTKLIIRTDAYPGKVIIHSKNVLTKHNDPKQSKIMLGKAAIATETTCRIFQLLKEKGIPVAYECRLYPEGFLAIECQMIPLEVIARRYMRGSFLLRYPEILSELGPRFSTPHVEFFLKTSNGKIVGFKREVLGSLPDDPETKRPIDDPFIYGSEQSKWILKNPKLPIHTPESTLTQIFARDILPEGISIDEIEKITIKTFEILEDVFSSLGLSLIDFKIEFGIGSNGKLLIADVIDNDSWRLETLSGEELSKELFRQDKNLADIWTAYAYVLHQLQGL